MSRPVIMYLGRPKHVLSLRRLLGRVLQGNGSIGDPEFMNPTKGLYQSTLSLLVNASN